MDNKIYTFTAPKGEGKTKWLMDKVFYNTQLNNTCYIITNTESDYEDFCESYGVRYHSICKAQRLIKDTALVDNAILFIDDFMTIIDENNIQMIKNAIDTAKETYITISGSTIDNPEDYNR